MIELINGNALRIPLADNSVQCCITSPPFYGLRKYDLGDQDHNELGLEKQPDCLGWATGNPCGECYVCHVVQWAREVRRVLRDDGIFWLNLGDSYNSGSKFRKNGGGGFKDENLNSDPCKPMLKGYKPKDLIGIPWRVALALQADGWYLRSDVIWNKPNPMPESVKDRCTKSHEYVFMLTKSAKYYFDNVAILEPAAYDGRKDTIFKGGVKYNGADFIPNQSGQTFQERGHERWPNKIRGFTTKEQIDDMQHHGGNVISNYGLSGNGFNGHSGNYDADGNLLTYQDKNGAPARNKRDVWSIATSPFKGAHYAVFPPALVEPMIKSSTSEKGCCPECRKPWKRIVEKEKPQLKEKDWDTVKPNERGIKGGSYGWQPDPHRKERLHPIEMNDNETIGWQPTCSCNAGDPVPCIVLDPFAGSGTTLLVSRNLGRSAIGCDLSYTYLHDQARKRLELDKLKAWIGMIK